MTERLTQTVYLLRHMLAVVALPATATIFVPLWLGRRYGVEPQWPRSAVDVALALAGILLLVIGMALFSASLRLFFSHGQGTLAPWDPPRRLVVRGPYRYVRNPMISGVLFTLFGLAFALRSPPHALWAVVFFLINATYIPLLEEPGLEHRFGEDYVRYRTHVPRFWPRLWPWNDSLHERV
jgi:protein-S-isoprenylcysteine O-methyltransferase Ste14